MNKSHMFFSKILCLLFIAIVFRLLASSPLIAGEQARLVWSEKIIVQDHLPQAEGKAMGLVGFTLHRGEFYIEVDEKSRKITSFSGVFRNLSKDDYRLLRAYVKHNPNQNGRGNMQIKEVTYENDGYRDYVFNLDLDLLSIELNQESYWALMNSVKLDVKLKLKALNRRSLDMALSLEFEDEDSRHNMTLLDWMHI